MLWLQISAQESRRKKKEFVDTLERQVEVATHERDEFKRKCEQLTREKAELAAQLRTLRAMVIANARKEAGGASGSAGGLVLKAEPQDPTETARKGEGNKAY
jgi:hypothetical protein